MKSTLQQKVLPDDAILISDPVDNEVNADTIDAVSELIDPTPEPERVEPEPTVTDTLHELAQDESPPDSDESHEAIKPPKNLDELAERLSVEVKDLYAIEFPDPETGESHTLGELKDMLATNSDLTGRELEIETRRVKVESEQVQARADLEVILKSLPPEAIMPEILAKARLEREVYLDREAARVLDVIPEWNDANTKRIDWKGIQDHMATYGYSQAQVDLIADHQQIRYMRDNMRLKLLVDKALDKVKTKTSLAKSTKSKPAPKKTPKSATPQSHVNDQVAAVENLLANR